MTTVRLNRKQRRDRARRIAKKIIKMGPEQLTPEQVGIQSVQARLTKVLSVNTAFTDAIEWAEKCPADTDDSDRIDEIITDLRGRLDENMVEIVDLYLEMFDANDVYEASLDSDVILPNAPLGSDDESVMAN